jgi:hypothetical protein
LEKSVERLERYLRDAEQLGGAAAEVARIRRAAGVASLTAENAVAFYPHEYLQYWSQNPLKMLPAETLTPQAKFNDVA